MQFVETLNSTSLRVHILKKIGQFVIIEPKEEIKAFTRLKEIINFEVVEEIDEEITDLIYKLRGHEKLLTDLLFDASKYSEEVGILLVDNGANIHHLFDRALRQASLYGHYKLVKALVERGSDLHARDDGAIRFAVGSDNFEIVQYLVQHGANVNAKNGFCLSWAIKNDAWDMVQFLIDSGANIDKVAMNSAVIFGKFKLMRYLIMKGGKLEDVDPDSWIKAKEEGFIEVII
jgi:ankyrin repeat protein